ncbi:MAG: hypothetical protein K2O47_05445, partial [Muribaculaceae bacterium]|nr:hypothetical protein [Muribaculaceae bacterium]
KKYIYSGRGTRWLEETGRNEIAVNVEDIVEKVYPKNQDAGLMAVAYMLDPAMDYVAPDGRHMTDPSDIAMHIYNNKLVDEVLNPESNLMVYFKVLKLDKTLAALKEYMASDEADRGKEPYKGFIATYYLAVLLNSNIPFPVEIDDEMGVADNVDMLLEAYNQNGYLGSINSTLLRSRAFIVWLSYRNPALAGKVRMLHDNESDDVDSIYYRSSSAYRIAYELNPASDLFFSIDTESKTRCYSIEQLGIYLNGVIDQYVIGDVTDEDEALEEFIFMDDYNIGDYLRARGEQYANFLKWNRYCMDTDDEENLQKAGPYDTLIGAYKTTAGFLGHGPDFPFGEETLTSPDDLKKIPAAEVAEALDHKAHPRNDADCRITPLAAWLAVFFQENPRLDLSKKFTYEKETAEYIEFIGRYAPGNYYVKRYNSALRTIDKSAGKLKKSDKATKLNRNIYLILCLIPTLALLACMILLPVPAVNPIKGHYMATVGLVFLSIFVACTASGNLSDGVIWGAVGGFAGAGIIYAGFNWFPMPLTVILGIIALAAAIYYARSMFNVSDRFDVGGKTVRGDEFEYRQLDALYFAYHQTDNKLDNVITKYSSLQRDTNKSAREDYNSYGWSWLGIIWPMLALWFFITPQLSGARCWANGVIESEAKANQWVLGTWKTKYSSGGTSIICHIDSIDKHNQIFGTMEIAGQAPVEARGNVKSKSDTIPDNFSMWPIEEGSKNRKCFNFSYKKDRKSAEGTYYDRKGTSHKMTLLSTPLAPWFLEPENVPAEVKGNKKNKTGSGKSSKASKASVSAEETVQESDYEVSTETSAEGSDASQPQKGTFWQDTM